MWLNNISSSAGDDNHLAAPAENQCCGSIHKNPHQRAKDRRAQEKDDPVSMIAQAMNSLSVGEREQVYEDVHGVADQVTETPELIQQKLFEFDLAIASIRDKPAFEQAVAMNPLFVQSERIKFLRSENYDAVKASRRMVNFFKAKLELWGEDKLHRQIVLTDLSHDDRATLESGVAQVLPFRDRSGRPVIFASIREFSSHFKTYQNLLRAIWYTNMSTLEDEENQRCGFVSVSYFTLGTNNETRHNNFQYFVPLIYLFTSCLPVKFIGRHACYSNDSKFFKLMSFIMSGMDDGQRARLKMHCGSLIENKYSLMSFGIPVNVLPVTDDGERKTANHSKWLSRRKAKEEALATSGSFQGIDLPGRYDVLLGRGQPKQTYEGNIRFNHFVDLYLEEYHKTPKGGKKRALAQAILVDLLKTAPYRFLRLHPNGWYFDVLGSSRNEIVEKILQTLRSSSSRPKKEDPPSYQSIGTTESSSKRVKPSLFQ